MLIVTLLYLLAYIYCSYNLLLISNISKLFFCYDLTQHLICFTDTRKINQQLSCIGCTSFVTHSRNSLSWKFKLLWVYIGASVMRANRHTAPVRHFITWPWFQHFKPSHKWQTKEMWLALKTCNRRDWKTHYNKSGFFWQAFPYPLSVLCVFCSAAAAAGNTTAFEMWGLLDGVPLPLWLRALCHCEPQTLLGNIWTGALKTGAAKLFLCSKECAFAHEISDRILAQTL